ncbi:hypothetical protein GGS21DRAFT_493081 [Xylaria nigripes]|nr:hypothetical protein GGS21DRAFT_493081 [Xylaria nigripes]
MVNNISSSLERLPRGIFSLPQSHGGKSQENRTKPNRRLDLDVLKRASGYPNWTRTVLPTVDISAAGLLALADLGTIAQRTRISGASWLDSLLLAPGLHYQQAADAVLSELPSPYHAVESVDGKTTTYSIANTATLRYLERVGRPNQRIVLEVGKEPERIYFPYGEQPEKRKHSSFWRSYKASIGWLSQLLYLASPLLTIAALVFMVLLRDWWGVGVLVALMLSRMMNIWIIKQRSSRPKTPERDPKKQVRDENGSDQFTEYVIDLGHGRIVCLRGLESDLQAITTTVWLRDQTHVEGYLEAASKLTVYLVAALSGNLSQVASIIFIALLLITAGLLGLSNAHAKVFSMHGRLAAPTTENLAQFGTPGDPPYPDSRQSSTWAFPARERTTSGFSAINEYA